jgi:hypothetical protein
VICVGELTVKAALTNLSVTDVAPVKFVPVIVTLEPTGPLGGEKLVIVGAGTTGTPQPGNLKEPIRVRQPRSLVEAKYSLAYQNVQSSDGSTLMLE